jgi:hypothetical protein
MSNEEWHAELKQQFKRHIARHPDLQPDPNNLELLEKLTLLKGSSFYEQLDAQTKVIDPALADKLADTFADMVKGLIPKRPPVSNEFKMQFEFLKRLNCPK